MTAMLPIVRIKLENLPQADEGSQEPLVEYIRIMSAEGIKQGEITLFFCQFIAGS